MKKKQFKRNQFALSILIIVAFLMETPLVSYSQSDGKPAWTHYYIDPQLAGSAWGTGGIGLADFDGDGDLDMALCRREPQTAYWYERTNDSIWVRHVMGISSKIEDALGSIAIDMNQDGWIDVTFEGIWFQNPGNLGTNPDEPWIQHPNVRGHDAICADINGDGNNDLVTYDGQSLLWFNTSDNLKQTIVSSGNNDHGGVAPHGFGDIDGDGDGDLVIPGYWFANPGKEGETWVKHSYPFNPVPDASYGRSIRSWIVDINADGRNDIVYSNCDTGYGHVYWAENKDNGTNWQLHKLEDPPTNNGDVPGTGSFHSLAVADFDQDGNLDIFSGEQEDPDQMYGNLLPMKPKGLKERGMIWYSSGGNNPTFTIYMIHVDNPGWHDAQIGDVDGDGDIDIVSKIWNKDGSTYHADFWRNELKSVTSSKQLDQDSEMKCFPNPFGNHVQLKNLPQQSKISVFDTLGGLIMEAKNENSPDIDLEIVGHCSGLCIIQISGSDSFMVRKFKVIRN